jgi:KipI family sensor histidine kinase inhibitor
MRRSDRARVGLTEALSIRPVGDAAWLLEGGGESWVADVYRQLASASRREIRDLVPAARSLLVILEEPGALSGEELGSLLSASSVAAQAVPPRLVEVPLRYDGEDLPAIAARAGLTVDEVVERHSSATYSVAFLGFQPGFPYLRGLPPELATPRRGSPRPRVPAGSVAIGAGWCGIYPAATPGGWNLLGTTALALFDPAKRPPSLLLSGDLVRFLRA